MRVGLVLGAGGVVGASWLIGALEALEAETGWRAVEAERIVGTSAGAVVGALAASGISSEFMSAYAAGRKLDGIIDAEARADALSERVGGSEYRLHLALPPIGPGSWRLAVNTMLHLRSHSPAAVVAGWLPRGFISTKPIHKLVQGLVRGHWPDHSSYWAIAADYSSGKRIAFGRDDAPKASVAEAVAASCAIPGFYHPVKVAGRRYVDGGICSTSNLDLLCGAELDLVVCLNPMSSVGPVAGGSPADRFARVMRAAAGRRLAHEARKLRAEGTHVLILQPGRDDCALMGLNLMSGSRRVQVMEQARKSIARELHRLRGTHLLPARGQPRAADAEPARRAA
ncbi:MAG TPA: patatin-like phospholipase family protein [Solirubrobacteraceae bacterium]|nr:patatin-like phospholipase family protein [Solirubrobacteraceae bacterium]